MLRIRILDQKFYSELRNGSSFSLNPSDYTTYLAGCVGERIRAVSTIDVAWWTTATNQNPLIINGTQIERTSGSWITDGFAVGDTIKLDLPPPVGTITKTVTYVDATYMIVDTTFSPVGGTLTAGTIYGITPLEGMLFDYGLIENNENTNFNSKIDGSQQGYYGNGLVSAGIGVPVALTPLNNGIQDVWQNGSVSASYEGVSPDGNTQYFEITHDFIILPYYQDGYLPNLQNNSLPLLFAGSNTLKYATRIQMRDQVANPNTNKEVVQDDTDGSVGFFNQNFNGFNNTYSIVSVDYGAGFDAVQAQGTSNITIVVNSSNGTFAASDEFLVGISYLPDSLDYVSAENYETNFLYDVVRQTIGGGATGAGIITNLVATLDSPNQITITFDTDYTAAQQLKLNATKYFALWVEVGDGTLTNASDDRVALLVDAELYDYDADVEGLCTIRSSDSQFYPHCINYTDTGWSDIKGWIEDGYVWKIRPLQLTENAEILTASFILGAANAATGDFFELQRYDYDVANNAVIFPIPSTSDTTQLIEIDTTRGFQLASGDQFNFVKWSSMGPFSGSVYGHEILTGFKINWESWIANPNAPAIFYDAAVENNGLNQDASRYSLNEGYAIVARLDLSIQGGGSITNYVFESPDSQVEYYDSDGTGKPDYCCKISTLNQAETANLNGNLLTSENTKIRARFARCDNAPFTVLPESVCGIIRLDVFDGGLNTIEELSTFRAAPQGQKLIPLTGESFTKITIDGGNLFIDLECEVDKDLIEAGVQYCISSRIWFELGVLADSIDPEDGDPAPIVSEGISPPLSLSLDP